MGIENEFNNDYFVYLDIGTPPQTQQCKVDMGSSDSFFISTGAASYSGQTTGMAWIGELPFNASESTTLYYYPQTFAALESFYFNVSGVFAADDITVQTKAGYGPIESENANGTARLTNMTFGLVENEGEFLRSCLIGLGLQGGELSIDTMENGKASPVYDNFPIAMKDNGLVNRVSYSVFLNQTIDGPSFVLFGGVDHSKYRGNLSTVPLVDYATDASLGRQFIGQPTDFQVVLSGISVSDGEKSIDVVQNARLPINVAFGTKTSTLPSAIGSQIARIFGMTLDNTEKILWMPCDREGYITLNFSGTDITIPLANFLEPQNTQMIGGYRACKVLLDTQDDPIWEIGDSFFRAAYVYVDLESFELSFAPGIYDSLEPIYEIAPASGNITNATHAPLYDYIGLNSTFNISTNNQTLYQVVNLSGAQKLNPCISVTLFALIAVLFV